MELRRIDDSLQQRSFEFALTIVRLYKKLQARQEHTISPQLLKSGTRIGLLIEEAIASRYDAERSDKSIASRYDAEHSDKLIVAAVQQSTQIAAAQQEAREAYYWLRLLQASRLADVDVTGEIVEVKQLLDLLAY